MRSSVGTPRRTALVVGMLASFGISAPVHAQFGKLKKMGADAIKEAAKGKVADKKPDPKSGGSSSVSARETFPTLTEDKVALVLASLAKVGKRAQIEADAKAVRPAFEARRKASNDCVNAATEKMKDPTQMMAAAQANAAKMQANSNLVTALQKKLDLAQKTKNTRMEVFVRDSVTVLSSRTALLQFNAGHCVIEYTPAAILEEEILDREDNNSGGMFDPGEAVRGVMTYREFGLLRERIALWALLQEDPTLKGGPAGVFTAEEVAALKANAADIKKLTPAFKAQTLPWAGWSDVKQWDDPK